MSERADFSEPTKCTIAGRSGYRCAFPECNRATIGPGAAVDKTSSIGVASHIYAASEGGPRGQGTLTAEELSSPENGIWLCATHSRLVDNNRGTKYPPELLLSYRTLHEARIARELQGLVSSWGWLHEFRITQSPIFIPNTIARLGKLNLVVGDNGSGKSALCEWLAGTVDHEYLGRWCGANNDKTSVDFQLKYFHPESHSLRMTMAPKGQLTYELDGLSVPFCPVPLRFVFPKARGLTNTRGMDDLQLFVHLLRVEPAVVKNLCAEVQRYEHARVRNIHFSQDEECDGLRMHADVEGTCPGLPFSLLSGREQERVLIELATAAARVYARHVPTTLILDASITIFFENWFEFYAHHFSDPSSQFQTIVVIPTRELDITKLRWLGWEVIRMTGRHSGVQIDQNIR